jgi:hypothetical protein
LAIKANVRVRAKAPRVVQAWRTPRFRDKALPVLQGRSRYLEVYMGALRSDRRWR